MKRARAGALLWTLVWAVGCSAEQQGRGIPNVVTPLKSSPSASAQVASVAENGAPALDLQSFAPLLSLPELKAAAEAVEADDPVRAARAVEAAMARGGLDAATTRSLELLLARLREAAGDLAGAAASYDHVAAENWPLSGYATLGAGRVLVRAGRAKEAFERLQKVRLEGPIADDARLVLADAASLLGESQIAVSAWREHLAPTVAPDDLVPVSLRLAETLLQGAEGRASGSPERADGAREALGLVRRATARATDAEATTRAASLEARALLLLPPAERTALAQPSPEDLLDRMRLIVDAKQYAEAGELASKIEDALGPKERWSSSWCEAELLGARALSGLGDRAAAEARLRDVAGHCANEDVRARALFLAGRAATQDKRYAEAVRDYELLESQCAAHRLADDARLRRALCYQEIGAEARFTDLLTRMPDDYPEGDMVLDGMFELATRRIEKGDWAGAAHVLERAATLAAPMDGKRGQEFAGRERYFRARAWGVLGESEKSLAELAAIVRELPLSYYMLHAYSRLAAADPARAEQALSAGRAGAASSPFSFSHRPEFDTPGFARALELLRVGDVPTAAREIDALGLASSDAAPPILWGVAALYARAGAAKLSHAVAQGLLTDWLGRWPEGDWERAWQVVFPRPYRNLVEREAKRSAVPESLVYAVMREESSFDPAAESPVKAYGLMQLIEPTARRFGAPLGLRADAFTLKRPSVNVAIGCRVLSDLTRTFSENPLLAIPGYNAGAGRPRRWMSERPTLDFDVWVERIPFQETRRYTKRVLASRAAYAFLYAKDRADEALKLPLQLVLPARLPK